MVLTENVKMRFLTYGNKEKPPVMLIHGMATTAEICYGKIAAQLAEKYFVILSVLDGHDPCGDTVFHSLDDSCRKIEMFIKENFGGHLYALSGFSLGGSITVELLQRGHITVDKVHLDAAFCVKLGALAPFYTFLFVHGIRYMQSGRVIPECITDSVFGKGNNSVAEMLFPNVKSETIRNCCHDVYDFEVRDELRKTSTEIMFWLGENEPYPRKSVKLLYRYLPAIKVRMFRGMGHGQLLHEHRTYYLKALIKFLSE